MHAKYLKVRTAVGASNRTGIAFAAVQVWVNNYTVPHLNPPLIVLRDGQYFPHNLMADDPWK